MILHAVAPNSKCIWKNKHPRKRKIPKTYLVARNSYGFFCHDLLRNWQLWRCPDEPFWMVAGCFVARKWNKWTGYCFDEAYTVMWYGRPNAGLMGLVVRPSVHMVHDKRVIFIYGHILSLAYYYVSRAKWKMLWKSDMYPWNDRCCCWFYRYDCRGHLHDLEEYDASTAAAWCAPQPDEDTAKLESMCQAERYRDLIQIQKQQRQRRVQERQQQLEKDYLQAIAPPSPPRPVVQDDNNQVYGAVQFAYSCGHHPNDAPPPPPPQPAGMTEGTAEGTSAVAASGEWFKVMHFWCLFLV